VLAPIRRTPPWPACPQSPWANPARRFLRSI
jgi:hypothetical protein